MPKSDTWPGGVAMESLSNMDSAGSCDSVISMNSGYSEDSMEHLSAEERACLMYLEETIEALEVQEDSGLSNDELDYVPQAENYISSFTSESRRDLKPDNAELPTLNQTSEPQSSPASAANMNDVETSANLMTQHKPSVTESVTGCEIHPPATQSEVLCLSKDGDGQIKIVSSTKLSPSQTTKAPGIDLGLIPPPSGFRDKPGPLIQPVKAKDLLQSAKISNNKPTVDLEKLRQRASAKRTSVNSPVTQEPPSKPPELSPVAFSSVPQMSPPPETVEPRSPPAVAPKPKKLPANIILKTHKAGAVADGNLGHSVPTNSDRLLLDPQRIRLEALRKLGLLKSEEADTGPILSPKHSPKTRRSWAAPSSPISPAAPHTPPMTPSYTRLNSPSPASSLPQSPASNLPQSPASSLPQSPASSLPQSPASNLPQSPAVVFLSSLARDPADEPPDFIPAPPAFSDPNGSLLSDNEPPAVKDLSEATAIEQVNTPPHTPPALARQLTPTKVTGLKSTTLERSGPGLSSYMVTGESEDGQGGSGKQSPSQLRNSRPRPASLGCGKEFSSTHGEGSQVGYAASKEPDLRRSLPAFQHSGDSQKLPRSQGISVLICPRSENEDDRREALKRLGLLRD